MVLFKLATKSTNFIIIYLRIDLNSSLYHRIYRDCCLRFHYIECFNLAGFGYLLYYGVAHVGRRGGSHAVIVSVVELPRSGLLGLGGHVHYVPGKGERLTFAGFQQAGLTEGFQLFSRFVQGSFGGFHIGLNGFPTGIFACVLNGYL